MWNEGGNHIMRQQREPSFVASLFVFASIIAILVLGIFYYKVDMQALLLLGMVVACSVAFAYGFTFEKLFEGMKSSVDRAMGAMLIFILIGATIGTWILGGAVPTIIYFGLEVLSPSIFLPAGFIICSLTSLATGTSWGTVGTVGLAMMGMGISLGIPAEITAGMVVSGAFFGDKMSPMSDTTNLSAANAGTNLYEHIGSMLYTTVPAFVISLILYSVIGLKYSNGTADYETIYFIQETLASQFKIHAVAILPMVVVIVLSILKKPTVPTMVVGVLAGGLCAMLLQGASVGQVLDAINKGYTTKTGHELIDGLLVRGGINSMMYTFSLSFIALCLGGVLEKAGFLDVLLRGLIGGIKSAGNLVLLVITSCFISNMVMGEIYLSIILNGSVFRKIFEKKGLKNSMLSRLLEEGATMTGGLIPWTTAGAFIAGALKVNTLDYLPYAFLNILNPIISIVLAYMGIFIFYKSKKTRVISEI